VLFADLPNFFQSDWWLAIGLAAIVLYMLLHWMGGKKSPPAQPRAVERQMENLLVDLAELSRQIGAQLDTRAAKLELLIKQADERIAQLKGQPVEEPPAPPVENESRYIEIYRLADAGQSTVQIAQQLNRPQGEIELILALRPRRDDRVTG